MSLGSGHGGPPDNAQAIHFAWRMCDAPECLKHADLLAAAVASLEAYDLVGTFTDVQGFTDRYCDALAVARRQVPRLNVTTARARQTPVSPGVINRLRARNTVDAALYEWARQRFSGPWRPPVRTRVTPGPVDFGNREIEIISVDCRSSEHSDVIRAGVDVVIQIACLAHREERNLTAGIAIRSERDEHVFGTNSRLMGVPLNVSAAQSFVVTLTLQVGLPAGRYRVTLALHKGLTHQEGCYHWRENTTPLIIRPAGLSNEAGSSYTAGRDREKTAVTIAYRSMPRSSFAKYLSD